MSTPSARAETESPETDSPAPDRLAWIDATAGVAGDMLLGALVDAGADLEAVQAVIDALIPASVRFRCATVDRGSQRAAKVDVDVLVENPPHRTWASIRTMLEDARRDPRVPERTVDLALEVFSRLAVAEGFAHGIDPEEVHFHEVGALDSLADVIGACEAWRQLGITRGVGSVIAVGSGRIRAAHGDIPVPVPAVARLAEGWPTVAGEMLPARGHGHSHDHGHSHSHSHGDAPGHDHHHEHGDTAGHAHGHDHDHDHDHDHHHAAGHAHAHTPAEAHDSTEPHDPSAHPPSSPQSAPTPQPAGSPLPAVSPHPEDSLPAHVVGGPHAAPARPLPPGVAPGIGELATPTGVALIRGLAEEAGPLPALVTERIGIGAGTKDTPGRPNVVRAIIGRPWQGGGAQETSAAPSPHGHTAPHAHAASDAQVIPDTHGTSAAHRTPDAHGTPQDAVQLEANVDDLDPRLWPGVISSLLEAGALDAWLTPIVMKQGRPALTVHALVREEDALSLSDLVLELTGSLGVRRHAVQRHIRTRSFETVSVRGSEVRVKIARDADGSVRRAEPEFRDVQALAVRLGITERAALELARAAAAALLPPTAR